MFLLYRGGWLHCNCQILLSCEYPSPFSNICLHIQLFMILFLVIWMFFSSGICALDQQPCELHCANCLWAHAVVTILPLFSQVLVLPAFYSMLLICVLCTINLSDWCFWMKATLQANSLSHGEITALTKRNTRWWNRSCERVLLHCQWRKFLLIFPLAFV